MDINDSNKHISAFQTDDRGFKKTLKKLYKKYSIIDFLNT